jgi:hypothetical protein
MQSLGINNTSAFVIPTFFVSYLFEAFEFWEEEDEEDDENDDEDDDDFEPFEPRDIFPSMFLWRRLSYNVTVAA